MPRCADQLQPVEARDLPPDISVWLCDLAALPWDLATCQRRLPPELAPGPAPLRPIAHLRRMQTRALLHGLLAEQLGVAPQQLTPSLGPHGKPELPGLAFNSSHSGSWALLALGPVTALGIDLEEARPRPQLPQLLYYFLNKLDLECFNQYPKHMHLQLFYRVWTAKEAALKAWGRGLDQLGRVVLNDLRRPRHASIASECACRIHTLALPAGLIGALATT